MKLTFDQSQSFRVPESLNGLLNNELAKQTEPKSDSTGITFNFRDPNYSADTGGYHPVEIRIVKRRTSWQFEYITDFCYVGHPYPELEKCIDVCFDSTKIYTQYGSITDKQEADEYLSMFLSNFVSYAEMGVFTVKVSFD